MKTLAEENNMLESNTKLRGRTPDNGVAEYRGGEGSPYHRS